MVESIDIQSGHALSPEPKGIYRLAMRTMSIAISSFQRREPLVRLMRNLRNELLASPDLSIGLEIVVILDGSTDGSEEAVRALEMPVRVGCHWQENRGLAAARNAGLAASKGEIIWFLDDDLVPGEGVIRRHRLPPRSVE